MSVLESFHRVDVVCPVPASSPEVVRSKPVPDKNPPNGRDKMSERIAPGVKEEPKTSGILCALVSAVVTFVKGSRSGMVLGH